MRKLINKIFLVLICLVLFAGFVNALIGCDVEDILEEGGTKEYAIDGKEYEVNIPIIIDIGTIYAEFVVNGEATPKMEEGDSTALLDGSTLTVIKIMPNEAGGPSADMVKFCIEGVEKNVPSIPTETEPLNVQRPKEWILGGESVAQWSETTYLPENIITKKTCTDSRGNTFEDVCEESYGVYKFNNDAEGKCEKEFYYCIDYYYKTCSNGACSDKMSEAEISNLKEQLLKHKYPDKCEQGFEFNKGHNGNNIVIDQSNLGWAVKSQYNYALVLKDTTIVPDEEGATGQKATIEVNYKEKEFTINEFQEITGIKLIVNKIYKFHGKNMVWGCFYETPERKTEAKCIGCWDGKAAKCYPTGKRIGDKYCDGSRIIDQNEKGEHCIEHYECLSNLCDPTKEACLSLSFWGEVWNWLKGLLG